MYIDKELLMSSEQAISASGDNLSTYSINLGAARNIAKGRPLYVVVVVDELFAGTGTTMQVKVISATNAALTAGVKTLVETAAIAKASLTAGRVPIVIALPPLPESGGAQQYLGLNFSTDNTFETTGKVTAFIALDATTNI